VLGAGHQGGRIPMQGKHANEGEPAGATGRALDRVAELEAQLAEERRRAAEIATREAVYRSLLEASHDLIFMVDREDVVRYVNPAAARLFGAAPEALEGRRRAELFPPEVSAHQAASLRRVFETGESYSVDNWIVFPTGRLWANSRLVPLRGPSGEVEFVLGFSRDITERKLATEALAESEERYRALFEQAADAVVLFDAATGAIVDFNDRAHENLGYTREEFARLPLHEFEVLGSPEEFLRRCDKVVREGHDFFCTRQRGKNGEVHDVQVRCRHIAIRGRDYILSIWRDVTDQKRAEDALRLSELQYRSTLDSFGDAIHVVDRDFRLVLINRRFKEWGRELGIALEAERRTLFEVFPFLPEAVCKEYRHVFETGETLVTEESTRVGGQEVFTETRKIPVIEDGVVVRVVTVVRDVTVRRKLEQEMLKAQKLESIGLLAGGIAHDFNNLLAGVLTNLGVARRSAGAKRARALAEAERAAERARDLTQRLLTFSGGGAPIRSRVHLAPLIREAAELALAGSDVRCDLHAPDDLWPAHADAGQIAQVVQNLLVNARQAMPQGGTIEVRAENVRLRPGGPLPVEGGPYVCLCVRDHGVGIPTECQARVFDPFFTTKQGGLGLGLAASYSIVRKHGGHIGVESQLGRGSTFSVYLPAVEPAPAETAPAGHPPAERSGRSGGRVLLMDDDAIIRRGAAGLLRDLGYQVACAANGAEAVELYAKAREAGQPFDVVILDLLAPRAMNGDECLRALRKLDPEVAAVACSGYSEGTVLADFRDHGFRAVLRKPFTLEELDAALAQALAARGPAPR